MPLHPHPTDARTTCLTSDQLHLLATLHGRALQPVGNGTVNGEGEHVADANDDLRARLAQMEAQVATLQVQLVDLTLQLLREREQRTEERLLALEANEMAEPPTVTSQVVPPAFARHATEKRLIPLVEYGARGRYVLISPEEGELPIMPDSPDWFEWVASLSSFRFVGQAGRFCKSQHYSSRFASMTGQNQESSVSRVYTAGEKPHRAKICC